MSQFHLKYLLNSLNDETTLVDSLPILIPSVLGLSTSNKDEASYAKIHTRLSALLQSKNAGSRWAGVCLVKAMLQRIEGRWESLISHGLTWIKLLLRILERENFEPLIERTISTAHTIFQMTEGKPSLTRDLTTPSLPTLFTHIFAILAKESMSDDLLKNILYHLQSIVVSHPTTFRPFAGKLQALTTKYLNGFSTDAELIDLAARNYASLHLCAPKNTAAEQWATGFNAVLGECHATCSYIFQTVIEQKPLLPVPQGMDMLPFTSDYATQVAQAVRRLQALLATIKAFLSTSTKDIVKIPVGQVVMLIQRMLEITPKSGIKASTPQSSQVALISVLSQVHAQAFDLTYSALMTLGSHLNQHSVLLEGLILSGCTNAQEDCKVAALRALSALVSTCDVVDKDKEILIKIIRDCITTINAIVPSSKLSISNASKAQQNGQAQGQRKRKHAGTNEGSDQISHESQFHTRPSNSLLEQSVQLLQVVLTNTHGVITKGTRQSIDNTVLKLLLTCTISLDTFTTLLLLSLLKDSLFSAEPSIQAAALLAAGITTISSFTGSSDSRIREYAITIRNDIEVLIHPRFPAMRRKIRALPEEYDDDHAEATSDHGDDKEIAMVEDEIPVEVEEVQATIKKPLFTMPAPAVIQESTIPDPEVIEEDRPTAPLESFETTLKKPRIAKPSIFDREAALDDDSDEDMEGMPEICTDSDTDEEGEE